MREGVGGGWTWAAHGVGRGRAPHPCGRKYEQNISYINPGCGVQMTATWPAPPSSSCLGQHATSVAPIVVMQVGPASCHRNASVVSTGLSLSALSSFLFVQVVQRVASSDDGCTSVKMFSGVGASGAEARVFLTQPLFATRVFVITWPPTPGQALYTPRPQRRYLSRVGIVYISLILH